jgi:hypothetical protein
MKICVIYQTIRHHIPEHASFYVEKFVPLSPSGATYVPFATNTVLCSSTASDVLLHWAGRGDPQFLCPIHKYGVRIKGLPRYLLWLNVRPELQRQLIKLSGPVKRDKGSRSWFLCFIVADVLRKRRVGVTGSGAWPNGRIVTICSPDIIRLPQNAIPPCFSATVINKTNMAIARASETNAIVVLS